MGFHGRGLDDVVPPDLCSDLFLKELIFQWSEKWVKILGQHENRSLRNPTRAAHENARYPQQEEVVANVRASAMRYARGLSMQNSLPSGSRSTCQRPPA